MSQRDSKFRDKTAQLATRMRFMSAMYTISPNKNFFFNFHTSFMFRGSCQRSVFLLTLNCLIWPSIVLVNRRSCPYACVYLFSISIVECHTEKRVPEIFVGEIMRNINCRISWLRLRRVAVTVASSSKPTFRSHYNSRHTRRFLPMSKEKRKGSVKEPHFYRDLPG